MNWIVIVVIAVGLAGLIVWLVMRNKSSSTTPPPPPGSQPEFGESFGKGWPD